MINESVDQLNHSGLATQLFLVNRLLFTFALILHVLVGQTTQYFLWCHRLQMQNQNCHYISVSVKCLFQFQPVFPKLTF